MAIQTIFEVSFKDGRLYRVACKNSAQNNRFERARQKVIEQVVRTSVKTNDIHTVKEWEQIVENETNN